MRRKIWIPLLVVSALIAIFIFQDRPEPKHFSDFVPEGAEIVQISSRNPGNGELNVTTDPDLIRHFTHAMQNATFTQTDAEPVTGNSSLKLSDKNGQVIAYYSTNMPGICGFNGDTYREKDVDQKELSSFFQEFRSEKNVVKGKSYEMKKDLTLPMSARKVFFY